MKYAQLVIGPAGCGKSTYCHVMQEHCRVTKRICRVVNLDPAAETFLYEAALDVRELVKAEEVMSHFSFGPNAALVFSMEYLLKKHDWLEDTFNSFGDDDFILIDCPGQIELYTHNPVMRDFLQLLQGFDFRIVAVYCLDVGFVSDASKFIAGAMTALSTMIMLEIPHVNLLTKFDMLSEADKEHVEALLDKSPHELVSEIKTSLPDKYRKFNEALVSLLEDWSLVSFAVLDINDEESIAHVLLTTDHAIQCGEDREPDTRDFDNEEARNADAFDDSFQNNDTDMASLGSAFTG